MQEFLNVVLDWTARDGNSQPWVSRRTSDTTRTRVKAADGSWEIEFYCDVLGNIAVKDARTGKSLFETRLAGAQA